jgi:hypothetical protein
MFDLLTGQFVRGYKLTDGTAYDDDGNSSRLHSDGKNLIFLRDQKPVIGEEHDYFDNWTYDTTDIDYIV